MEKTKIEKIRKAAGITARVLRILEIICIIAIVLALISGVAAMILKSTDNLILFGNIRDENSTVRKVLNITDPDVVAGLSYFIAMGIAALILAVVIIVRKTFLEIEKSDTPFRESILKRIRITGILLALMAVEYSIPMSILTGLTAWCVYCIFDYGIELQKQDDETL